MGQLCYSQYIKIRSRRPRGSLKFHCHLVVFIASTQLSFLGRRFLRCVATLLLELVFTSSPAHPLRRAYAPTTCSSCLHSGLAWLGDQGVKSSSSSTASSTAPSLFLSSQHRFGASCLCAHSAVLSSLRAFRRWCRTSSVSLPSALGGGHASGHRGRFHRRRL